MSWVKVCRLAEKGDLNPLEFFEGFLVDEQGNPIDALSLGKPIFVYEPKGRKLRTVPWTFRTASVVELGIFDPGIWEVVTNDGSNYSIDPNRVYH